MTNDDSGSPLGAKTRRQFRVEKTLREIIGQRFMSMNSLFGGAMVTVVRVSCGSDLRTAQVFVSVFNTNDEHDIEDIFDVIEEQRSLIQHRIGKELPMKFCPKLKFVLDSSIDKLVHFSEVLNESKTKSSDDSSIERE